MAASSKVNVILLDESVETFEFAPRSTSGLDLMAAVCRHLELREPDYFGLVVEEGAVKAGRPREHGSRLCPVWIKPDRCVRKQETCANCESQKVNQLIKMTRQREHFYHIYHTGSQVCSSMQITEGESLRFRVKYYPPHPDTQLKASYISSLMHPGSASEHSEPLSLSLPLPAAQRDPPPDVPPDPKRHPVRPPAVLLRHASHPRSLHGPVRPRGLRPRGWNIRHSNHVTDEFMLFWGPLWGGCPFLCMHEKGNAAYGLRLIKWNFSVKI